MGCPFITGWTETPCDGGACSDAFRLGQCRDAHSPQFCGSAVQFFDLGRLVPPVASRWIGWCSHSHLAGWQTGGCKGAQLHRLTFPRRLAQASPHGDLRAPGSKSRQASQFIGAFVLPLTSCLLMPHWPKKITWPNPDPRSGSGLHLLKESSQVMQRNVATGVGGGGI